MLRWISIIGGLPIMMGLGISVAKLCLPKTSSELLTLKGGCGSFGL